MALGQKSRTQDRVALRVLVAASARAQRYAGFGKVAAMISISRHLLTAEVQPCSILASRSRKGRAGWRRRPSALASMALGQSLERPGSTPQALVPGQAWARPRQSWAEMRLRL